jgi:hypothetical protein
MKRRLDRALSDAEAAVLLFFWTEAEAGEGWCRQGVRGWRFRAEVEHHIPFAYEDAIKQLRAWGLLESCPVPHMPSDPLLRISSSGAALVSPDGEFHRRSPELHRKSFFLSFNREWATLQTLASARTDKSAPVRFGRRGWQSIHEARRRYGPAADAHSAGNLTRMGLLEQRRELDPRGKRVLYSRATAAGARLVIVGRDWYGEPAIERVEVADEKDAGNLPGCPW